MPVGDYYSDINRWKRGVNRALTLADMAGPDRVKGRMLEAGCGDGMTSLALSTSGGDIVMSDLDDWRDGRAKTLPFVKGPLENGLPFDAASFDFVFSFESFEHFVDPAACFRELTRLCRPGGRMFLNFGPLYASPWGLHAFSTIRMPYAQFLFSQAFIDEKVRALGIWDLGKRMDALQPLNRWRLRQFVELWRGGQWTVVSLLTPGPWEYLHVIDEYPEAFRGRGLSFEDVTTQAIVVCLERSVTPC